MNKLICNHCRAELTIDNIKDITFGRTYEMVDGEEIETEIAYVECSRCGNITETDSATGDLLRFNLVSMRSMNLLSNRDILYNFNDIRDLLEHLYDTDIEKVKDCKFKVFEQSPDDDSGDVYYYITIFKDDTEIGKITMYCNSSTTWDLETNNEIKYGEPSYSYTMELNKEQSSNEKDYIECTKCHNKILGKYWLNVKYQGHYNYGDYEENIYNGECPICGETIETDDLQLYVDSMEASETELQHYYKVIGNFGYNTFPFEDCDYSEICAADELTYIKNALVSLTDILNVKYLYNIDNIKAIQSNKIYNYNSEVITNIFQNTSYADFDIDSIKDCKFRVLDCSVLNDIIEENLFDTSIISLILQVIRNNKILGYINVEQQYPLDTTFTMFEVKKDSNKRLIELCKTYTSIYDIKEDTSIMLSKSRTDGFNTPVCKKCGQVFCDCNLKCKICGKIFCEHKY